MWTNLLYSFVAITSLATTGTTWYASPKPHEDLRAVDEIEILLGGAERCIVTQTNATGYQATQMFYAVQTRNTNGAMETVTNALTWQLVGKDMLTANDNSFKAAIPFYVATNTATNLTAGFVPLTFTGLVDTLLAHTNGLNFQCGDNWTVDTNVLRVTGTLDPDVAGKFTNVAAQIWQYGSTYFISNTMDFGWTIDGGSCLEERYLWSTFTGDKFDPYYPRQDASGIATVELVSVTNLITLAPSAVYTNQAGVYSNVGWTIYEHGGGWVCASNSPPSGYYFTNATATGAWVAVGGFYTAGATSEEVDVKLGFQAWLFSPITFTNYEDRYKVLNMMEQTHRDAAATNMDYWRGYAEIETNALTPLTNGGALAYAAAVGNYAFVTSGVLGATLIQDCLKSVWRETNNVGSNIYQTNLVVTTTNNLIVTGTDVNFQNGDSSPVVITNLLVTGTLDPDVTGVYTNDTGYPFQPSWELGAYHIYRDRKLDWWYIGSGSVIGVPYWMSPFGPESQYYDPGGGASGTATVTIETVSFNPPPSGTYTNTGAGSYTNGGWLIYEDGGGWVCASNDPPSGYYFTNSAATGTWGSVGFETAGTTSEWEYTYTNNPVDPSGTYTPTTEFESHDAWAQGDWTILYSNSWYYITTNTAELSPAWKLETETPPGAYSNIVGTGITGTATVAYSYLYEDVYETNIIYACELRKYGADYYAHTGTDVAHRVQGLYVLPQAGTHAASNDFHDHGLSLSNSLWNSLTNTTDWTRDMTNSFYFGSPLTNAPDEGADASDDIPSVSHGFRLGVAPKCVFEWDFLYCTNRYW